MFELKLNVLDLVAGIVISSAGWGIVRLSERRRARAKEAREACLRLRILMGEWMDGIRDAVTFSNTAEETLKQLQKFNLRHHFEDKFKNEVSYMKDVGACGGLMSSASLFRDEVFDRKDAIGAGLKGLLRMRLITGKFGRDYERYKEDAISELQAPYDHVQREIDRAVDALKKEERKLL